MIGTLTYGLVTFDVVRYNFINRRTIFGDDGVALRYKEITVDAMVTLNPVATSYTGIAGNAPVFGAGSFPVTTDQAIVDHVMQPQRRLKIQSRDATGQLVDWIVSPPPGNHRCDAWRGPIVQEFNIVDHFGVKTWLGRIVIVTWVICDDLPSPIITHRWSEEVILDQDRFTTRKIVGEAVFHCGMLTALVDANDPTAMSPDLFRDELTHAIPNGYTRDAPTFRLSSDNSTLSYELVDRQVYVNLGKNSVSTRVQAFVNCYFQQGSVLNMMSQQIAGSRSLLDSVIPGLIGSNGAGAFGSLFGLNAQANQLATDAVASNLPRYVCEVHVRCWGDPAARKADMLSQATAIAVAKIGQPDFFTLSGATTFLSCVQQLDMPYVDVSLKMTWSHEAWCRIAGALSLIPGAGQALALFLSGGAIQNAGSNFIRSYFSPDDDVKLNGQTFMAKPNTNAAAALPGGDGMPAPGGRNGSQGIGVLEVMIAQVLSGQCESPALPPRPQ